MICAYISLRSHVLASVVGVVCPPSCQVLVCFRLLPGVSRGVSQRRRRGCRAAGVFYCLLFIGGGKTQQRSYSPCRLACCCPLPLAVLCVELGPGPLGFRWRWLCAPLVLSRSAPAVRAPLGSAACLRRPVAARWNSLRCALLASSPSPPLSSFGGSSSRDPSLTILAQALFLPPSLPSCSPLHALRPWSRRFVSCPPLVLVCSVLRGPFTYIGIGHSGSD